MYTTTLVLVLLSIVVSLLFSKVASNCDLFRKCVVAQRVLRTATVCRDDRGSDITTYNNLNYQWNLLIPLVEPIGYFLPKCSEEVQIGVKCAQSLLIHVVPKSGGHDYGKYSFGNNQSLIIDLQRMTSFDLASDKKSVSVGPGFLSGPLVVQLETNKLLIPNGLCPTVGISYALGGGYSFLSRQYGLVVDNILELDLVTAGGHEVTVNTKNYPDLFWALRGAGHGSFGIVTRYKFKVHPIPPGVVYGRQSYERSKFPEVFDAFQKFTVRRNLPRSINCILTLSKKEVIVEIIDVLTKIPSKFSANTVNHFFHGKPFPIKFPGATVKILTFSEYLRTVGAYGESSREIGNATRKDTTAKYFYGMSFYVTKVIDLAKINKLNKLIQQIEENISLELQMNGGAINDFYPTDMAYVHRGQNFYKVNVDYQGPPHSTVKQRQAALSWQHKFFKLTKQLMNHKESYQQNVDPELSDYLKRYYAQNLKNLTQVKRIYDPLNLFRNPQSIPLIY